MNDKQKKRHPVACGRLSAVGDTIFSYGQRTRDVLSSVHHSAFIIHNFLNMTDPQSTGELFQAAIQRILPHRYPFLLVDRVTELVPGQRIRGVKQFTVNDEACQGNAAPGGMNLVPAGVLIEMVVQLGAILVMERPQMAGKVAVILQIMSARMIEPVELGDSLVVEAEVVKLRENFGELRGAAYRDGKRVAEGAMRFGIANAADLLPAGSTV